MRIISFTMILYLIFITMVWTDSIISTQHLNPWFNTTAKLERSCKYKGEFITFYLSPGENKIKLSIVILSSKTPNCLQDSDKGNTVEILLDVQLDKIKNLDINKLNDVHKLYTKKRVLIIDIDDKMKINIYNDRGEGKEFCNYIINEVLDK